MKRYTEVDSGDTNTLLNMVVKAAKGAKDTIKSFIEWMKSHIGTSFSSIKEWFISTGTTISDATSAAMGKITAAFASIGSAIASAISSTKEYIVALSNRASDVLAIPVFGITYGKLLAIAVISAAVIFVMYKVYKAIKKRKSNSVSEVAAAKGDLYRIKKSINESIAFFDNMNYILREDASGTNGITKSTAINMIAKADGPAREMVNWITKKTVNEGDISATGNFLRRHDGFIRTVCTASCAIFAALSYASSHGLI